jgi:TorA maturation chaperone TorD
MREEREQVEIILANRSYLYQLLQVIFGSEPDENLLTQVVSTHTEQAIQLFYEPSVPEVTRFLNLLGDLRDELFTRKDSPIDRLSSEYTRLFLGPTTLPAPPWESVYVTSGQILFQEVTLNVRKAYARRHFLPKGYPNEADDHLALELDFMFHLATQTHQCFMRSDHEGALERLQEQKQFLSEHLLVWTGRFAEKLKALETRYFYPQCAEFMVFFLGTDSDVLAEVSQLIEEYSNTKPL